MILEGKVRYEIKNIITDPDSASKHAKKYVRGTTLTCHSREGGNLGRAPTRDAPTGI